MIAIFGDSWARQAYKHTPFDLDSDRDAEQFYQHWALPVNVTLETNIWLHHFFAGSSSINQAQFGNTLDWIVQDLWHFDNIIRYPDPVKCVVFQTDPLRIMAPRSNYLNPDLVMKNFKDWCTENLFDWQEQDLDHFVRKVYKRWYEKLEVYQQITNRKIYLVGGVSPVHDCVKDYDIEVIIPSISKHFGLARDTVFENRASLNAFVDFWCKNISRNQTAHAWHLKEQWDRYDRAVEAKESFWIANPKWFAGRHMTATAMQAVAAVIEQHIQKEV